MQRLVGNHATARMIQGRSSPSTVQRFDTGEHAQMGSNKPILVNGVSFTRAQLTAMGDLYENYDQMATASPAELRQLKADIEAQTKFYKGEPGGKDVPETKGGWDEHTGGRYLKLAAANQTHFAPGQLSQGHDHKTVWEQNHIRALQITRAAVMQAGLASIDVPQEAQAINAFGNHFLTDAFAAGHLIAKADVMDEAKKSFDSLEHTDSWWQPIFYRNEFTDRVAETVMSDPKARVFNAYELKLIVFSDVSAHRLSEFLFQFANRESELFYSNIVKSIHDQLNHATAEAKPGSASAIQVENARGQKWQLPGDTTLSASPRTLEVINLAIAQAEANLDEAAQTPAPSGPLGLDEFEKRIPELLQRVWSYTPHMTAQTQKRADAMRTTSTETRSMVAAQHFATVILDHLPEVIDGLEKKGFLASKASLAKQDAEFKVHSLGHRH